MNVQVRRGSAAEYYYRSQASLPEHKTARRPKAIVPGIPPSPAHDLIFHGGKTVPQMHYTNFYLGGSQSRKKSDINSVNTALAAAMSDTHLSNVITQYFPSKQIGCTFLPSQ